MKIKKGLILREIGGKAVVIATGDASLSFHGMIKLNETEKEIWKWIDAGLCSEEIADKLCGKYGIDRSKASSDVAEFTESMAKAGFLEL